MKSVKFIPSAYRTFVEWAKEDPDIFEKIAQLIEAVARDPFKGLGKPEPLKGNYAGCWSRRITQEHRLIYRVENEQITILKCHGHYT